MKISFFSDLHIKRPHDSASELFLLFAQNKLVSESHHIYLLGDMFDFLIGEHPEYIKKYSFFFRQIVDWLDQGKKVTYIEGNHDFHFQQIIEKYLEGNTNFHRNFEYQLEGRVVNLMDQKYFIGHGYEVDYYNEAFKRWKSIYTSSYFKFMVNKLIPYSFVELLAAKASRNSKKRGRKSFDLQKAKLKYIAGADAFLKQNKLNGIICGHTHIQESHIFPDKTRYYNCGFPVKDENFLYFSGSDFSFINLKES